MDYALWSEEYYRQAKAIMAVIEKKKAALSGATADERKQINTDIINYRFIYYDLIHTADHLFHRAVGTEDDFDAA